ncbi:hypothetical protein V1511DRAFT_502520 [Dipodascopsis uninucleata]
MSQVYEFSALDRFEFNCDNIIKVALIFSGSLDERKLYDSLWVLISEKFKVFGGHLTQLPSGNYQVIIPEKFDEASKPFNWTFVDHSSKSFSEYFDGDNEVSVADDIKILPARSFPQLFGKITETGRKTYLNRSRSFLSIYITKLSDVTAIQVVVSHMICDAGGLKLLLSSWQEQLNGKPVEELHNKICIPSIEDVGSKYINFETFNFRKKLVLGSKLVWSYLFNGRPSSRRLFLSHSFVEALRQKVINSLELHVLNISRYDILFAISILLCVAGQATDCLMCATSVFDLRRRISNNDRFPHNFYLPLPNLIYSSDVKSMSFADLVAFFKKFRKQFIDDPNDFIRIVNYQESLKPVPSWIYPFDVSCSITDWGSFNFLSLDFSNAAETGTNSDSPLTGRIKIFQPLTDFVGATYYSIFMLNNGPFDCDGVVLYHTMPQSNWRRAESTLGDIAAYIRSLGGH